MSYKFKLILSLAMVYIVWGSTYLGIYFALETIPPFMIGAIRFTLAGSILLLISHFRGKEKMTWTQWKAGIIIGFLLLFIGNGCVIWTERSVPSGLVALIISTTPLFMVLIDWARPGGKYPTHKVMLGILIGIIGVIVLFGNNAMPDKTPDQVFGIFLLFFAMISWSVGSVYSRTAPLPKSSATSGGLEMFSAGIMFLVVSLFRGEFSQISEGISLVSVGAITYLFIFGSIIAFTAYTWLLKNSTTSIASTYAFVNPVVAVFLGWLLAGDLINKHIVIACAIIVCSVVIITIFGAERKKKLAEEHTVGEPG